MTQATDTTSDPTTMLATLSANDGLHQWSDEKKREFVDTFAVRVVESRYVLCRTAEKVLEAAERRKFISSKHEREIDKRLEFRRSLPTVSHYEMRQVKGARGTDVLDQIADQRAKTIINTLPPLKTAVQVIDKETAKMITQLDAIKAQAQTVADEIDECVTTFKLSEVEQDITIGEFRSMVESEKDRRNKLIDKLHKLGKKGTELDQRIAKALFAGLPGLSDAVVDCVIEHYERAMALVEIERRVSERVKFGDSDAAMDILATFEKDEVTVNEDMTAKITAAMDKLKTAAKALRAGKKKASKKRAKKGGK